jgi:hypothetical protein
LEKYRRQGKLSCPVCKIFAAPVYSDCRGGIKWSSGLPTREVRYLR